MKRNRTTATVLAMLTAAVLLALVAGCGGGDDSDSSSTSQPTGELSAAELASTGDDLCTASAQVELDAPAPDFGDDGPQAAEVKASAPYWEATAAEQQRLLDQLSELQPPADLQKKYDEFLKLQETANVEFALTLQKYAEASDMKAFFRHALQAQKDLTELAASAQGLGMTVCGATTAQSSGDS